MNWELLLENLSLGGYCPAYWKTTYPSYGNKNQAAEITSVDMTDPSFITQGLALADVDTETDPTGIIKGITRYVTSADKAYGISATKIYEIQESSLTEKSPDSAITGGEDIVLYGNELFWSHDTDIGKADNPWGNANENWWTDVAGGSALTSGKTHQLLVAGTTGLLTVLNGSVVASWDGSTATDSAFDSQDTDIELVSQVYNQNRFWFAGNKPNASGRNESSIFVWDGNSSSWQNEINVGGKIGALWVKDGITFVFYTKNLSQTVCTLGYIDGTRIVDVANYSGSLPEYYQVCNYEDFILWASGTDLMAWGGGDLNINTRIFKLGTCGAGGLGNPFGTPITAASNTLKKFSGYATSCGWKSLLFDCSKSERRSKLDEVRFYFEKLASGAKVEFTLKNNQATSLKTGSISFASDGAITTKKFNLSCLSENFRVELDWSKGSASNPVSIRKIRIKGHYI
jgi:hypothetical protein